MVAITMPPENCTIGREMPKNLRIVAPSNSMMARKIMLLIAIRRDKERYNFGGASEANPRKTRADPSGLISGRSTLKDIRNEFQRVKIFLPR
jgi:hypothetical protein